MPITVTALLPSVFMLVLVLSLLLLLRLGLVVGLSGSKPNPSLNPYHLFNSGNRNTPDF